MNRRYKLGIVAVACWVGGCASADGGTVDDEAAGSSTQALGTGTRVKIGNMWYTKCGAEGETCQVGFNYHLTAYGVPGGNFVFKEWQGSCTNSFYGADPAPGVVKSCYQADYGGGGVAENATSFFTGSVAFGANGQFAFANVSGAFTCNTATFGDPAPGVVKKCFFAVPEYNHVRAESNTSFSVPTNTALAFGAAGNFSYKVLSGNIACNTATFGDPAPGVVKACYRLNHGYLATEPNTFTLPTADYYYNFYGSGKNGIWYLNGLRTGSCSNTTFGGDPHDLEVKMCWGSRHFIQ